MSLAANLRTLLLACAFSLAAASAALAHAHLKSAVPATGATVATAPASLQLTFSEGVDLKFTGVTIAGPGQKAVATGAAIHIGSDDTTLDVPVTGPLAPGKYTVKWHALSTDGHKTNGTYIFTVKP